MTALEVRHMHFRDTIVWNMCYTSETGGQNTDVGVNDHYMMLHWGHVGKMRMKHRLVFRKPAYWHLAIGNRVFFNARSITKGSM